MTPIERAVEALKQSITSACAQRGGKCNGTPGGLLDVQATFDPKEAVKAVLAALRSPSIDMENSIFEDIEQFTTGSAHPFEPKLVWTSMIDAALEEG